MRRRLYLYGIVQPPDRRNMGPIGIEGAQVMVVPEGEVAVAYSATTRERLAPSRADLTAHERVLERLLQQRDAVLPFSFGTLARDRTTFQQLLAVAMDEIRDHLEKVRGCVEVGLKVFWRKEAMQRDVETVTGPIPDLEHRGDAERRNRAIVVGQIVERLVLGWQDRYTPVITARLFPLCEDVKESALIGPTMLWNGSFLVRKDQEGPFRTAVMGLDDRLGQFLDFRYVAPLPPYNFVDLRIHPRGEGAE